MLKMIHSLAGVECEIYYPQSREDLSGFFDFLALGDPVLGLDTETTGLNAYGQGNLSPEGTYLRLVQFGNRDQAGVLRADLFADAIVYALRQPGRQFTLHNAPFDLQVIDRHLGVKIEELANRAHDTRVLAHLLDPRQKHEGGSGLHMKELAAIYVDPSAPDTQDGLNAIFRTIRDGDGKLCTKDNGWRWISIDEPTYVRYAGLDPILAVRLFYELAPLVRDLGLANLSQFEHHFQILLAIMQRKGVLLDVDYIRDLSGRLAEDAERYAKAAKRYGVENVNSTVQVADALLGMDETLVETTDSGAWKVDKAVLLPLADLDQDWNRLEAREPNMLADAVLRSKRAAKWRESYAEAFLNLRDSDDRLHAMIGGLQARTARMSISRPPLQQLPSGDWTVRRALIADPGHSIIAADYAQVEMRVLAALCQDPTLKEAILSGEDLHNFTARRVFGEEFTKRQRKIAKGIGFGKVYGGGAETVSRQSGAPIEDVRPAMTAYDKTFPGIKRYARKLQSRAEYGKREVVTVSGRHLPLDRDRLYAATNYVVQSTARDLLAQAIVDLFEQGYGDALLLPVHDEVIAQAPTEDAEDVIRAIGRVMESTFYGIPILSDPEVYGPSWGHGYGATE